MGNLLTGQKKMFSESTKLRSTGQGVTVIKNVCCKNSKSVKLHMYDVCLQTKPSQYSYSFSNLSETQRVQSF